MQFQMLNLQSVTNKKHTVNSLYVSCCWKRWEGTSVLTNCGLIELNGGPLCEQIT